MTELYRHEHVAGDSWRRAKRITIVNPYNEPLYISVREEEAFKPSNQPVSTRESGRLSDVLTPDRMDDEMNLINPETGEVERVISYKEAFAILYSVYLHLAMRRDVLEEQTHEDDDETD